jgi:hypothetical protein
VLKDKLDEGKVICCFVRGEDRIPRPDAFLRKNPPVIKTGGRKEEVGRRNLTLHGLLMLFLLLILLVLLIVTLII